MVLARTRISAACPIVTRYVRNFQAQKTHHGARGHSARAETADDRHQTRVAGLTYEAEHFARAAGEG